MVSFDSADCQDKLLVASLLGTFCSLGGEDDNKRLFNN